MERSVKKAYGFSGFLTNMINVEVPRQIAGDPKPKKFNRGYSLNGLPIDGKIKVRIGIGFILLCNQCKRFGKNYFLIFLKIYFLNVGVFLTHTV